MSKELTNTEKAALTLMSVGQETASLVLQHLTEQEVKRISRAFLSVQEVDRETQFSISREFKGMLTAGQTLLVDGKEFAKKVISNAFGEAEGENLLEYITGAKKEPIGSIVKDVPPNILANFIMAEHPQTVAFLMTKLSPGQAAEILEFMPEQMQTDVLLRIANLQNVKSDVVDEVREVLRQQLKQGVSDEEKAGGPKSAADILNFVDRTNEARIIGEIEETFPNMAEEIKSLMFTFEDLKKIDDKSMQAILKEVPRDQLVITMKSASAEVKEKIFKNISKRAAEMINDDLSSMGPVKLKDVEKAQQGVIDIARKLEAEGKVNLSGGSDEEYI
jgi:flagellar motor switch protein FliG